MVNADTLREAVSKAIITAHVMGSMEQADAVLLAIVAAAGLDATRLREASSALFWGASCYTEASTLLDALAAAAPPEAAG